MDNKDKLNLIDELETSDSSLENYLDDLKNNNEYLEFKNKENEFQNSIFNYVKQKEQEQNELLEMQKTATEVRKNASLGRKFIKYAKIAFITVICVSLTRSISNINFEINNSWIEEDAYDEFKNSFSQVRKYLLSYEKNNKTLEDK